MTSEPKFEWMITDLTETEIRGTDEKPIIILRPYWSLVGMKYPNFTAINYFGKRRITHSFKSDDIETTLKIIANGGDVKDVAKALATNVIWAEPLMKHCRKLAARIVKAEKLAAKKVKVKPPKRNKPEKESKGKVQPPKNNEFTVDLNKDITVKLNNWI